MQFAQNVLAILTIKINYVTQQTKVERLILPHLPQHIKIVLERLRYIRLFD